MRGFRELIVWQKAHEMTVAVYEMTRTLPLKAQRSLLGASS